MCGCTHFNTLLLTEADLAAQPQAPLHRDGVLHGREQAGRTVAAGRRLRKRTQKYPTTLA